MTANPLCKNRKSISEGIQQLRRREEAKQNKENSLQQLDASLQEVERWTCQTCARSAS
jgi:hypothetical protein